MRQLRCHWFLLLQPYSELLQFARETDLAGLDGEHHSHVPWVSLCSGCMVCLTAISILPCIHACVCWQADFKRNFIVQSLQGCMQFNSLDLDDFDDRTIDFIALAASQDRAIPARVLRTYFGVKRRQSIVNPSAFVIDALQRSIREHQTLDVEEPCSSSGELYYQDETDTEASEPATTACATAEEPAVAVVEEASSGMFSLHRARSNVDELYYQDKADTEASEPTGAPRHVNNRRGEKITEML